MSFEPNNYTAIPNVVFDYWMEKLSHVEFKILCTLCRKIFGWHKTSDAISIKQICKVTNLARSTVIKALKSLEDKGLLVVTRKEWQGCQYINQYSLKIEKPLDTKYTDPEDFLDDQKFEPQPKNNGGGPRNELGVVRETDQGVVRETDPQKKDYTKERLTKYMSPPAPKHTSKSSKDEKILYFGEFESVLLTQAEYDRLVNQYGKEIVDNTIESMDLIAADLKEQTFRNRYSIKSPTYNLALRRWIKRGSQEGWNNKPKNPELENEKYAYQIVEKHGEQAKKCYTFLELGPGNIQFTPTLGQKSAEVIDFRTKDFKKKLDDALRRWRIL